MKTKQHIEGWVSIDFDDNLAIVSTQDREGTHEETLAEIIANNYITNLPNNYKYQLSTKGESDEDMGSQSLFIPNCNLSFYISDKKISLESVQEKYLTQLFGGIDIYTEYYGYSMWTITGFDVDTLTIGGHDLETIIKSYKGKYIHILIEYDVKRKENEIC